MPTMTDIEVLQKAKALIEDPERWCRRDYAKDADGKSIAPDSPRAVQFCSIGAIYAAEGNQSLFTLTKPVPARKYIHAAGRKGSYKSVYDTNDYGTHADVMAMFDEAIRLAQEAAHA